MFSREKLKILTPFQKLPENVGDLGKLIVAKCFKTFPKMQKIAQSGHTAEDAWKINLNAQRLWKSEWMKFTKVIAEGKVLR